MKPEILLQTAESLIAPVALSKEYCQTYQAYDNSGLIVNSGKDIQKILFSLDFSMSAVQKAIALGCQAIFTHHPAVYGAINVFDTVGDALAKKLSLCMQNGISVISMHLNFDCAPQGIDHFLMQGLGGEQEAALYEKLSVGGYGRAYAVTKQTFGEFCANAQRVFSSQKLRFYGDAQTVVQTAASFCGTGSSEGAIAFAVSSGADVYVSSDMKHHQITDLLERGLCVVEMTHYASEVYGFEQIYKIIANGVDAECVFHTDKELL